MKITITLVNGEVIQQTVESESFIIGRSSKVDVVVPHEGMSRQHCQIEVIDGDFFVTDLGSTNGVLIDGEKIEPHKKVRYHAYYPLSFGAVQNLFIEAEDETLDIREIRAKASSPLANNTRTVTKAMLDSNRTAPTNKPNINPTQLADPKAPKKDNKLTIIMSNVLAVLILVAAIVWYMNKDSIPIDNTDVTAPYEEKPHENFDRF